MSLFITFEGGEGSGKSTQARSLYRRLYREGFSVILTHEPGGTNLGNRVRRWLKWQEMSPTTELLLFTAARAQLVAEIIRPLLEKEAIVICDRYSESTVAYQGYGRGLDSSVIKAANDAATQGLRPDLIVLLDIATQEGLGRKGASRRDRFEREELAFLQRMREGYLKMAAAESGRWLVVDASLLKQKVEQLIWERVEPLLKKKQHSQGNPENEVRYH